MPAARSLDEALAAARPFLRGEEAQVDAALPELAAVLRGAGAGECWHKHGTFLAHLLDVHRILRLWGAPDAVLRCGLFHSAYSNSYVNLAIFQPDTRRAHVAAVVAPPPSASSTSSAWSRASSSSTSTSSSTTPTTKTSSPTSRGPRRRSRTRAEGSSTTTSPGAERSNACCHQKASPTGEDVALSRRIAASFLLMTMADFSDQLFDWQDRLFDNHNGRLEFRGNTWTSLWPGSGKPGLWVSSISRMAALYALIVREEEIYIAHRAHGSTTADRDEDIDLVIPPVFHGCTEVLSAQDQKVARDLYWEALCTGDDASDWHRVEQLLQQSTAKNPFVGEPHLVLAQVYLNLERYGDAQVQAEEGLRLLLEWGSSWDKRMPWEAWVSWGRAMLTKAKDKAWPHTSFGIISLGLVK
nr:unnamed protein product [Digitaria exilis]